MPHARDAPAERIREAIRARGPVTFAEFMEIALYSPGGFYDQPPVGERGHFVTSPHVHPIFGELLGRGLREMWAELGEPRPFHLVELGAGDGTLAGQVRSALSDVPKRYVTIERSAGARAGLARLPGLEVAASLESLDQHVTGVVFANELLDNLPFARVRRSAPGKTTEVHVALEGDRFVEVELPCRDEETVALSGRLGPDGEGVVPTGALRLVERLARVLRRGFALLIDYEAPGGAGATHGYRGHRPVADVLAEPGSADITAGVDFEPLVERATSLGLRAFPPIRQTAALQALGFRDWIERRRTEQAQAQDRRAGREAVVAWSDRNEAALLVDPAGLGGFRWLVLKTPGLGWPQWLVRAGAFETPQAEEPAGARGWTAEESS